jgi:hypothetical protein
VDIPAPGTIPHARAAILAKYLVDQRALTDQLESDLAYLDQVQAEAEKQAVTDPFVLVRQSVGARRRVYHSADHPCGRTQRKGSQAADFETMRESEAVALDHGHTKRCPACNWAG